MNRTFYDTTLLREIEIPESVEEIGQYTFSYCRGLEKLIVPERVTVLGHEAASNCNQLTTVVLPENLTEIGSKAFHSCQALTDVQLPKNLEKIGWSAFAYCTALKHIELPDSVKIIDYGAFYHCVNLRLSEHLPQHLEEIGNDAFNLCYFTFDNTIYPYISLPAGMKKLYLLAFENCQVSGLIVNNPDMEFAEPDNRDAYRFNVLAKNMWFVGYAGSTAQQFTENPDHPGKFILIDDYQGQIMPSETAA
ncbi:MAG TPA: hypothetical protein DCG49_11580 [Ruminococcus sp.]|nr:hypothetical protein [Ruminococcus sp.]